MCLQFAHPRQQGGRGFSMTTTKCKAFCFICGSTKALVGLDLIATKQEDRKFKKQIYYQVCEQHIPKLLIFLSGEKGLAYFGLWEEVD